MIYYNHLGEEEGTSAYIDQKAVKYANSRGHLPEDNMWIGCREGYYAGYVAAKSEPKERIVLTPEVMASLGFNNSIDYWWNNKVFPLSFIPPATEGERWAVKVGNHIITSVQYLHELQALVKVLTGKPINAQ